MAGGSPADNQSAMQPARKEPLEPSSPALHVVDAPPSTTAASGGLEWVSIIFLTLTPVVGILGTTLWTIHVGFQWWMLALCVGMYFLVGLSICAGYHRYFSHKTYECAKVVQLFYAVFGAMAAQNTILDWSAGHRRHHRHTDDDWDPYNIKRGFWWAHIFWVFVRTPNDYSNSPDLVRNRVVKWQQRHYKSLLIVAGFGLPTLIGALCGDWLAGLLWGGFLRIVVTHHSTFFVNSLAHTWGNRRYDPEISACDNWAVALLTLGEGYHSFHHKFPGDYRNGIRWYHWDPAKWLIRSLEFVGLAQRLKRVPDEKIEGAEMSSAVSGFERRLERAPATLAAEVRSKLEAARAALDRATALRRQQQPTKPELRAARQEWRSALRLLATVPLET